MKRINVASIALILVCGPATFTDAEPSMLAKQIALLPWKTDQELVRLPSSANSRITIVTHYQKAAIVDDEDHGYFGFIHPHIERKKNGDIVETYEEEGPGMVCRGGGNVSCDGNGNFETLNAEGFDYVLDLNWQRGNEKEESFKRTFHCHWVQEQEFEKDGFKVTVKVTLE